MPGAPVMEVRADHRRAGISMPLEANRCAAFRRLPLQFPTPHAPTVTPGESTTILPAHT